MKRLTIAFLFALSWMFWPDRARAQGTFDPIDVAVEVRRCLNDDVAISIAPMAMAPMLAFQGHQFVVWPTSALMGSGRHISGYDLGTPAQITIEFISTNDNSEPIARTLNSVANCGDAAWFILERMGPR
jgi:hypothetical protein